MLFPALLIRASCCRFSVSERGLMKTSKLGIILAVSYLVLLCMSIAYELSIRIYDRGNSEFAGMLSVALTFPTSVLLIWLADSGLGVKVGGSDVSFVLILGLAAAVNASVIYVIVSLLGALARR